jgi:hypothetical protein
MRTRIRGILVLPALLAACGGSTPSGTDAVAEDPPAACLTTAQDDNGVVAASFHSTVGAIRQLPAVANNAQLVDHADGEEAAVCYIDGQIPKGPPRPLSGTIPPSFDRAVLVVVGDQAYFIAAGYEQSLPILAP